MAAQHFGPADFDRSHRPELLSGQGVSLAILGSVLAEDVGYFQGRVIHD
jgi:hypothetical protein